MNRVVTKNWDGNQNDRLVEDGVREMTVRAKWMVMRTFGKGTTDQRHRHDCGGLTDCRSI